MKWTSEDCREISGKLHWPHSLLPDLPFQLSQLYREEPTKDRVLFDIEQGRIGRTQDPDTGMPVLVHTWNVLRHYKKYDHVWFVCRPYRFVVEMRVLQIAALQIDNQPAKVFYRLETLDGRENSEEFEPADREHLMNGHWPVTDDDLASTKQGALEKLNRYLEEEIKNHESGIDFLKKLVEANNKYITELRSQPCTEATPS